MRWRSMSRTAYVNQGRVRGRSELVSLRVEDFELNPEGGGSVLLRRGKTDQEGTGKWLHFSNRAVNAVKDWLESAQITDGYILRGVPGLLKVTGQLLQHLQAAIL